MTLKIDTNVPLDPDGLGNERSPFLAYLAGQFGRLRPGQSILVSEQRRARELAVATARGLIGNKQIAQRISWAFTRWSKSNGDKLRMRVRRVGDDDFRLHVVWNPKDKTQGEMNV